MTPRTWCVTPACLVTLSGLCVFIRRAGALEPRRRREEPPRTYLLVNRSHSLYKISITGLEPASSGFWPSFLTSKLLTTHPEAIVSVPSESFDKDPWEVGSWGNGWKLTSMASFEHKSCGPKIDVIRKLGPLKAEIPEIPAFSYKSSTNYENRYFFYTCLVFFLVRKMASLHGKFFVL